MKLKANKTTRLLKAPGGEKIATININEKVTGVDGPEGTTGDLIQVVRADDTAGWTAETGDRTTADNLVSV